MKREKPTANAVQTEPTKKKLNKEEVIRFFKFVGFSISAGVVQIVSFEILYDAIHWLWWPSYLISIILSVIWNFTFNRKFTFKSANNIYIAMMWVLIYYVAFIPVSVFGGNALEGVGWNGTLVTFLMMLLNFATEFLWQRFFVFRKTINSKPLIKHKTVEMKLKPEPFEKILGKTKTVEMRAFDEKRKSLNVGDKINFVNLENENKKLTAKIKNLKRFKNFEELYAAYDDKTILGYAPDEEASPEDMSQYYSKEDVSEGVVAIEIKVLKQKAD